MLLSSNLHLETLLLTVVCGNLYIHTDFWSKFCLLYWTASKLPRLLDTVSKLALFSMPGLKEEKLTKNANLHENWNIQILFLPNFIVDILSLIVIILSYTVSKLVHFLTCNFILTVLSNFHFCFYNMAMTKIIGCHLNTVHLNAPYVWFNCLTRSQAVARIADRTAPQ